jgi:glycine cleavage system H protein
MNVLYTKQHEWVKTDGDIAVFGISAHATAQLGDITFVELPEIGTEVKKGEVLCGIESVKAASDIYAPMSGTVTVVNDSLEESPELVNESPEDVGWIVKIKISEADDSDLMNKEQYTEYLAELD